MPTELIVGASLAATAVLGGTGVTIVAVEAARHRPLSTSMLVTRWKTWVVLATIWIVGLTSPAVLYPVLAALGLVAAYEYARLAGLGWTDWRTLLILLVVSTAGPLLDEDLEDGPRLVGQLLFWVALSDVTAFTVGSAIGRQRIAPKLSPKDRTSKVAGSCAWLGPAGG